MIGRRLLDRRMRLVLGALFLIGSALLFSQLTFLDDPVVVTGAATTMLWIAGLFLVFSYANSRGRDLAIRREAGEILRVASPNPLGLVSITPDASDYDYRELLENSRRVVIVLNDGRTWLSVHREKLRARFSDPRKQTTVFLVHPRSEFLNVLARKGSSDTEAQRTKIAESIQILTDIHQGGHNLEVLGHFLYNTHSVVIGDDASAVTPYYLSRGSRVVPVYLYADNGGPCYFREIEADVERLRMDSEQICVLPVVSEARREPRVHILKLHAN